MTGEELKRQIALYESADHTVHLDVKVDEDTVWLNRQQLALLFGRDIKTIGKHVGNALREELNGFSVVAKFATTGYYRLLYISSGGIADIFEKAKSFFPKSFSEAPIW